VDRTKEHRKVHKVAMAGAVEKQDALPILCSAIECANQKLVRTLNAERVKGEGLLQRTSSLEMQVTELCDVHAIANKAKVLLTKAAKVILNQKHKERVKAFEVEMLTWKEKVQAMSVKMAGLEEDVRDARKVHECPTSIRALFYSKISLLFNCPFLFTGKEARRRGQSKNKTNFGNNNAGVGNNNAGVGNNNAGVGLGVEKNKETGISI
jgi:hypothetical protein